MTLVGVPGFGDDATSWQPLVETDLSSTFRLVIVDLARCGSLAAAVAAVVGAVDAHPLGPRVLLGHSLGAVAAVRAARARPGVVVGVVSFEGNLTTADGYFSATAAAHADPEAFRTALLDRTTQLVDTGEAPTTYRDAIDRADAATLWSLGCDSARQGQDDAFGAEFQSLPTPSRYLWCPRSTPPPTVEFLASHALHQSSHPTAGHWAFHAEPLWAATQVAELVDIVTAQ